MKPRSLLSIILELCFFQKLFAQSITLTPNTQNMIDANSTTQGMLFPRITIGNYALADGAINTIAIGWIIILWSSDDLKFSFISLSLYPRKL